MEELQQRALQILNRTDGGRAIRFEGRWHDWASVRATARAVMDLVAAAGADPRATVLFIGRNRPSAIAALLGLIAAGRTMQFLYSFQSADALAASVAGLKPAVVLAAEEDFTEPVRSAIRANGAAAIALSEIQAFALPGFEQSTAALNPDTPAEPTIGIQTSGTTGAPKRFPVSYEKAMQHFVRRLIPSSTHRDGQRLPAQLFMALGNLSGMMSTLPALMNEQEMLLYERFNLDGWCDYIRTYRPEHSGMQPAALQMLLDADVPPEDLASLRTLTLGSAPLRAELQRAFEARYGITILRAYGATEFFGTVASMTLPLLEKWGDAKFGSVGPAVPGVQLRVVDGESGAALAAGEEGLLAVYSAAIGPDWIRTSDLAILDEDGFLFVRGRADGAINRGGFKLLPETIEKALLQHDAVANAAVVGIGDKRLGQVPAAAIEVKRGMRRPTVAELEKHLRQHLLATHIPVRWQFVDAFANTPSMKIDRGAVARLFQDQPQPV
jgi:acyl-coenzyme A synthetase/AMP-(fatty) acid ligase